MTLKKFKKKIKKLEKMIGAEIRIPIIVKTDDYSDAYKAISQKLLIQRADDEYERHAVYEQIDFINTNFGHILKIDTDAIKTTEEALRVVDVAYDIIDEYADALTDNEEIELWIKHQKKTKKK